MRAAVSRMQASSEESCPSAKVGDGETIRPVYQRPNESTPLPQKLSCQGKVPPSNQKSSACCQSVRGADGTALSVTT